MQFNRKEQEQMPLSKATAIGGKTKQKKSLTISRQVTAMLSIFEPTQVIIGYKLFLLFERQKFINIGFIQRIL
jgi:hypothetical protein